MRKQLSLAFLAALLCVSATGALAAERPNILILFPDDVGWQNVSAYGLGTMGYRTPNIDRIAKEGAMFTDHYAQPSCTAGRAALITGQYPIRSGMTTVGRPGAELGLKPQSHTLAEVLKEQGYATGQFGKNHLGDRNEHLPTVHGFDETTRKIPAFSRSTAPGVSCTPGRPTKTTPRWIPASARLASRRSKTPGSWVGSA
jgi:arylsulfatase